MAVSHNPAFLMSTCGVRMPRIIYGTAWKELQTEDLVRQALDSGFRGIDTACQPKHYHEPGVGAGNLLRRRCAIYRRLISMA
jgi:diketogulonate reductase-like aldo/keto reductase